MPDCILQAIEQVPPDGLRVRRAILVDAILGAIAGGLLGYAVWLCVGLLCMAMKLGMSGFGITAMAGIAGVFIFPVSGAIVGGVRAYRRIQREEKDNL